MHTRLKRIDIEGLKGGPAHFDLTDATFLYGPNGAGKTRLVDAILLLVLGYHPDLPKKELAILQLADGDEIRVVGHWDTADGTWETERTWTRVQDGDNVKGSKVTSCRDPGGRVLKGKEAEVAITRIAGKNHVLDINVLDVSADKRRALLFELGAPASGWTPDRVAAYVAEHDLSGASLTLKAGTGKSEETTTVKLGEVLDELTPDNLSDWLSKVVAGAKETVRAATQKKGAAEKANEQLTGDAGDVEPADVGQLETAHSAAVDARVRTAKEWEGAVKDAETRLQNARTATETRSRNETALTEVKREEAEIRAAGAAPPDTAPILSQIEEMEEGFGGLSQLQETLDGASEEVARTDALRRAAEQRLTAAGTAETAAARRVTELHGRLTAAQREAQAEVSRSRDQARAAVEAVKDRRAAAERAAAAELARRKDQARQRVTDLEARRVRVEREATSAAEKQVSAAREAVIAARTRQEEAISQRQTLLDLLDTFDASPTCPILQRPCAEMSDPKVQEAFDAKVEETRRAHAAAEVALAEQQTEGQRAVAASLAPLDQELNEAREAQRLVEGEAPAAPSASLDQELRAAQETLRRLETESLPSPAVDAVAAELRAAAAAAGVAVTEHDQARNAKTEADTFWNAAVGAEAEARRAVEKAQGDLRDLRAKLAAAESRDGGEAANRLAALAERRRQLEEGLRGDPPDVEGCMAAQADTRTRAEEANASAQQAEAAALAAMKEGAAALHRYQHATEVRAALAKAETELAEAKRIEDLLGPRGLQGKVVEDIVGPFTVAVNQCLLPALGTFEVRTEDDKGKEDCKFGLAKDGHFALIETLCGGERVAVYAAVLRGLAALNQSPWRPLVADRVEQVDRLWRSAFLARLVSLQRAGHFSQFIGAGCPDTLPAVAGLDVVQVGTWEEEAAREAA